jgi:hypothetical protein
MVEYLTMAVDNVNQNPAKDRAGCYKKGYIIKTYEDGSFAGSVGHQKMVCIKVPGLSKEDGDIYVDYWDSLIDFEVVAHNENLDGYRVRVWGTRYKSSTGEGGVSRGNVEAYLNMWSATVFSFGANEVTFDYGIYNMVTSDGFWELDVSNVVFDELSYNKNTGIHRVAADYSGSQFPALKVQRRVRQSGFEITSHADQVITFRCTGNQVNAVFKREAKEKFEKTVYRRRFYLPESVIDDALGNNRMWTLTPAEFQALIIDKIAE